LSTEKAALLFPLAVRPENKETDSLISEEFPVSGITDNGLVKSPQGPHSYDPR